MRVSERVLDVGAGDGHSLLDNADIFRNGAGLDDSEHMIELASAARDARGIRNVEFHLGAAAEIPFEDRVFDLVFSERGPLGHSDVTLAQALRVLRQGGLILVQTGGGFDTLQTERDRFEAQGVEIQIACMFAEKVVFPDYYEFFRHYCVSWCSYDKARELVPTDRAAIDEIIANATDQVGHLVTSGSKILIGGRKEQPNHRVEATGQTARLTRDVATGDG